ncbi:hypothetical protein D9619_013607 [Psilocybe cf. subviscida]|uniref:Extracellular serine-rich protein n=1 Tax=Psilocybe cf. subviscida TaxID=2480587 RepID=A0A8H5F942_9AGAR|nr:hypothetical protein D9619_013607 [Psilocybe cf. subviscida]
MLFAATLSALALATGVAAQNLTIQVGGEATTPGGIFQFIPSQIPKAANGSVITFEFTGAPGNHSITQSSFANPCSPLAGGFDSGWVLIPEAGLGPAPIFNLTITDDTKPIWFYCKQLLPAPHCNVGMVGAVNAPTTGNTFDAYQKNALAFKGTPGQSQGALVGVGASASAGIVGIPSGATAFPITASGAGSSPTGTAGGSAPAGSATSPAGASGSGSGASPKPTTSGAMMITASIGSSIVFAAAAGMLLL